MTSSHETPPVFQPDDPELQAAAVESLSGHYTVAEGEFTTTIRDNMNMHFNAGVPYGPWVASGRGEEYTSYAQGLPTVKADAVAEDMEKARRITLNAYPVRPVGKGRDLLHALERRAEAITTGHDDSPTVQKT